MAVNITLANYQAEDFLSVDDGAGVISVTYFDGQCHVGAVGWATKINLSPVQAETLARDLLARAERIKSES